MDEMYLGPAHARYERMRALCQWHNESVILLTVPRDGSIVRVRVGEHKWSGKMRYFPKVGVFARIAMLVQARQGLHWKEIG